MSKPRLAVAFDGTIAILDQTQARIHAELVPGASGFIAEAVLTFEVWVIWPPALPETTNETWLKIWLHRNLGEYANEFFVAPGPPEGYVVMVDSRAWPFNGQWPEPQWLLQHRTWSERQ